MNHVTVIEVRAWDRRVGAVALDSRLGYYVFAFDPEWERRGIEMPPLTMRLDDPQGKFVFPNLPGHLSSTGRYAGRALPDDFG